MEKNSVSCIRWQKKRILFLPCIHVCKITSAIFLCFVKQFIQAKSATRNQGDACKLLQFNTVSCFHKYFMQHYSFATRYIGDFRKIVHETWLV